MKKFFSIALVSLAFFFQGEVFGQTNGNPTGGPTGLDQNEVSAIIHETSVVTGVTEPELQKEYIEGDLQIQETNDGARVYMSTDHGGGIVDISEENF